MTNDFLEVATGGGANVEDQAGYLANATRTAWWPDGDSPEANVMGKMSRQASVIAHMIAQAVCDLTGRDMLDDGNAATQLANFKAMLAASTIQQKVTAAGTANALTITPTFPAAAAYVDGESWLIKLTATNTSTTTLSRNGLAAKAVVHADGSVLGYGDLVITGYALVAYNAAADKFFLLSSCGGLPSTYGEIIGAGSGNITIPANARQAVIEFCAPGGGGGTGDGGSGGTSGTWQNGGAGGTTTVNGVNATGGGGGTGGHTAANTYGGDGGAGGTGTGSSYKGQGGSPGQGTPLGGTGGNIGATGGSSMFGGGGSINNSGPTAPGYGGGGGGGQTGDSGTFTGAGGGGGESRRIVLTQSQLVALAGNIAYSIGNSGTAGVMSGNFPGGIGGPGYIRYRFDF